MITLRELVIQDVRDEKGYVKWLNDPEVNRYLESRHIQHTLETTTKYVEEMYNSKNNYLYGIFLESLHIGNIKIGNIDYRNRRADIGLLISKEHWGRGIAKEAIKLTEAIAFSEFKLHKLFAGMYTPNEASLKAFLRNGWRIVGEYKEHCIDDDNGNFVGCFMVEKINPNENKAEQLSPGE